MSWHQLVSINMVCYDLTSVKIWIVASKNIFKSTKKSFSVSLRNYNNTASLNANNLYATARSSNFTIHYILNLWGYRYNFRHGRSSK